ncbi:CaiB/BaiF CoA-transferase family protein [Acrocarpospora catenulata]|uniref:CaiB/BaiF CoA-transferase family protein n=1 Tax=Acrocarpospora catenulata TaxID=2836182 RepID=UPI001BDB5734|nr:CoA transferase [Acrocarpospora catenulata]
MSVPKDSTQPLAGVRVVELSRTLAGAYAGKLFVDLGAEVRLAEPTGGHPMRTGEDGRTDALFAFLAAGKESFLADLDAVTAAPGDVDVVIVESEAASAAERLHRLAETTVVASITPWGLTGPWSAGERPYSEFILQAEGGSVAMRGDPTSYPLMAADQPGYWAAGAMTAAAAAAALRVLERHGRGELIDVSLLNVTAYVTNLFTDAAAAIRETNDFGSVTRRRMTPSVERAADGWVGFNLASAQNLEDFMVLIERPDLLADEEMLTYDGRYRRAEEWNAAVQEWTRRHSVAEIVRMAADFRIPAAPVHNGRTLLDDPHVRARELYTSDATGRFRHPVVPYLFDGRRPASGRPVPGPASAPGLGGRPTARHPGSPGQPSLAGVRVLDLTSWWAGSFVGTFAGSLGADVIKIESTRRVDGCRMVGGTLTTAADWWEHSNFFLGINHNKRGITLDLTHPRGLELFRDLIAVSDVLLENFSPRVLEQLGLDWDGVRRINPRLVMVRMPAFGLTGPMRNMTGFAQTVEQFSGMCWTTGYPDGPPLNTIGPADPMAGAHASFALLAALRARDATGAGTLIESPLVDAALTMTAGQVITYTAYGRLPTRDGNRAAGIAPQGVYACRGTENWLALSVVTDAHWAALRDYTGIDRWSADERLATEAGRRQQHDLIDTEVAAWAAGRVLEEVVGDLVALGVPAGRVVDSRCVHGRPQIAATGMFEPVVHPLAGELPLPVLPFRFGGVRQWSRLPAPTVGQHNREVLGSVLGLTETEIEKLAAEHVIGSRPDGV